MGGDGRIVAVPALVAVGGDTTGEEEGRGLQNRWRVRGWWVVWGVGVGWRGGGARL